ncbi:MAG: thiamine-phosphate kinase [Candidatus Thorarchaeota archaeon]|nr:thiamine-phosphate kinase [Candidatus Thorarchaeota archaeon]
MKTGELGERNFLKTIEHMVAVPEGAKLRFDDDASDFPLSENQNIIVNVDTFVGTTDWLPGMTDAQVGRKTAVMALSDIAAKGGSPLAAMLSLCVPHDYDVIATQELIRGFSQYCMKKAIPFLGGDLGASNDVILTGVAVGVAPPKGIISRGGAKKGDVIAVTGDFGLTSAAYEILLKGEKAEDSFKRRAITAAYKPEIPIGLISALAEKDAVTSSMDSSDGLGITLNTMATQSNLSFVVETLPVAEGVIYFSRNLYINERRMVFEGGEEFILVVTVPSEKWDEAVEIAGNLHVPLKEIGYTTSGKGVVFESSEGYIEVPPNGYDNFREWE